MPVVVFYGEESYLLEEAVAKLRGEVVNPTMASLCHRVYSQPSLSTVLEAVGSVSLALGGKTLIEIRDFSMLFEASKDASTDKQLEELKSLLESVESTKIVLFASSKVDGKIKFPKWLVKHPQFQVQKFEPFKFWEADRVADILIKDAARKGISILPEAAELLVESLGTGLRLLVSEVDKLALYADNRAITRNDVVLLCNHSDNLFHLIDRWILQQSPTDNFRDLSEILLREHAVVVFARIQTYFNNIFRVLWLSHKGATLDTIAQRTGQKPFTIKKHIGNFRGVTMARWLALKHRMVELEWKTKTGQLEGALALETLLGA